MEETQFFIWFIGFAYIKSNHYLIKTYDIDVMPRNKYGCQDQDYKILLSPTMTAFGVGTDVIQSHLVF